MRYAAIIILLWCSYICGYIEKPIVIIVPSFNNSQWCMKNMHSIAIQKYSNYRVIYINDCSTDDTGALVANYIQTMGLQELIMLINNPKRLGALANLYNAIHSCDDKEIIVTLDGDDWFADDMVLFRINQAYQAENVWLTYGQFKTYPQDTVGFCRDFPTGIIRGNFFREYEWISSHPRTFYAALFKQIKLRDLLYEGVFFDVTWDMAFMYPMLEMAAERIAFIPDVLYVYNQDNVLNDFRQKTARQIRCKYYIASKPKYTRIPSLPVTNNSVDMLIVAQHNKPYQLKECLASIQRYVTGIKTVHVLYSCDDFITCFYDELQQQYTNIIWQRIDLTKDLSHIITTLKSDYILVSDSTICFSCACEVQQSVHAMQKTKAHAFYYALNHDVLKNNMPILSFDPGITAWQFKYGAYDFKKPFSTHMVLYKKDDLLSYMHQGNGDMDLLNEICFDYEHIGLCFDHAHTQRTV